MSYENDPNAMKNENEFLAPSPASPPPSPVSPVLNSRTDEQKFWNAHYARATALNARPNNVKRAEQNARNRLIAEQKAMVARAMARRQAELNAAERAAANREMINRAIRARNERVSAIEAREKEEHARRQAEALTRPPVDPDGNMARLLYPSRSAKKVANLRNGIPNKVNFTPGAIERIRTAYTNRFYGGVKSRKHRKSIRSARRKATRSARHKH
jgi:hypothetical protein